MIRSLGSAASLAAVMSWAVLPGEASASNAGEGLCGVAVADVERAAQAQGLLARVVCRLSENSNSTGHVETSTVTPVATADWPALRSGRTTWPVHVRNRGAAVFLQQIPLTVDLRVRAWVAVRNITAGDALAQADVALREIAWMPGAVTGNVPAGRLATSLRAGDVLRAEQLLPPDTARRGDVVQIVLRQGPLELRVPGQLLSQARVGENVRAQPLSRPAAITGVLTTLMTVESNVP